MDTKNVSAREKNRRILVEQFAYYADELLAQRVIIRRIPDSMLEGRPYAGMPSIRDRYKKLMNRERENARTFYESMKWSPVNEPGDTEVNVENASVQEILVGIAGLRQIISERLRVLDDEAWSAVFSMDEESVPLSTWVYQLVLQDTDYLREIGEHFYEQQISFSATD